MTTFQPLLFPRLLSIYTKAASDSQPQARLGHILAQKTPSVARSLIPKTPIGFTIAVAVSVVLKEGGATPWLKVVVFMPMIIVVPADRYTGYKPSQCIDSSKPEESY